MGFSWPSYKKVFSADKTKKEKEEKRISRKGAEFAELRKDKVKDFLDLNVPEASSFGEAPPPTKQDASVTIKERHQQARTIRNS